MKRRSLKCGKKLFVIITFLQLAAIVSLRKETVSPRREIHATLALIIGKATILGKIHIGARIRSWAATGDIYHQSLCAKAGPSGQSVSKLLLVKFLLFRGFCQLRRLFFFPVIQQGHNLFFHFGGSDLLAKILFQFRSRNNHASILLFLF